MPSLASKPDCVSLNIGLGLRLSAAFAVDYTGVCRAKVDVYIAPIAYPINVVKVIFLMI